MFFKATLAFLAIGALSVNALTTPIARSPAPEPESQELEAWMLKRDLSYDLFSRELRALDELFSREPEDRVEWAGFARTPDDSDRGRKITIADRKDGKEHPVGFPTRSSGSPYPGSGRPWF